MGHQHNPCLVKVVAYTLKSSGWRHVESDGKNGDGGGEIHTYFSDTNRKLQDQIKSIFVNKCKQNLSFQNKYVITLQCLSQG
jgi:hypothetical protein